MYKRKIDPADNKQTFSDLQVKIHCCRYWLLDEWECLNMSFPFWRLYYNTFGNASVHFKGVTHYLTPDKVILIPPNTSFSTNLKNKTNSKFSESIIGKQIESNEELRKINQDGKADHLFVHFNLGLEGDHIIPGLYVFKVDEHIKNRINEIKQSIIINEVNIDLSLSLAIYSLIFNFLRQTSPTAWDNKLFDTRVMQILNFIENHLDRKITNEELAEMVNMATNSFARLFHESTNYTLQEYIRKKRIERACNFMHHTSDSIDLISLNCGFVDRQHFSKVFKQEMNITPAIYKKHHTLDPNNQKFD